MPITEQDAIEALDLSNQYPDREDIAQTSAKLLKAYKDQQAGAAQPLFPAMRRREAEEGMKVRGYFTNKENHGLDEETKRRVYQDLPDEEQRAAMFSEELLSRYYQRPVKEVRALGTQYRDQYALEKWGSPVTSYKEFFNKQAEDFDFEDEITQKASNFALSGAPMHEADAALDFDYVEDPRYKGREDARLKQFQAAFRGVKSQLAGLEPTARVFVDQLKNHMGVGEGAGQAALPDEWFLETVMDIPKEKRDIFLSAVVARAGEGEAKTLFQAMAERMGRNATDIVRASNATVRLSKLDQLARHVAANGAVSGLPDEFGFSPDEYLTGYIGSREAADRADKSKVPAIGSEEFKALSPEQQTELERIEEERDFVLLYKKVNDIATGAIDPAKGSNWYTSGAIGVAGMLPNLGLMAMGPAGMAVNARGYISQRTLDHAAENPGVDTRDSIAIGTAQGIVEAMLDVIPMKVLSGKTPLLAKWLKKPTLTRSGMIGRGAARLTGGTIFEGVTEFGQEVIVPSAVEGLAQILKAELPEANWDARLAGFTSEESLSEIIPSIVMLSFLSVGVGSIRDYKGGWQLVGNRNLLIGAGITEADADAIVSAAQKEDAAGAQTLLRDSFAKLDQTKEISDVLPEARRQAIQNIQAEVEMRIAAEEKGEISGIIPKLGRDEGGFYLRFQDSSTRYYQSQGEASQARWDYANEKRLDELDQFRGAISMVERGARVGEEFDFAFENRRDDLRQARDRGEVTDAAVENRIEQAKRIGGQKDPTQEAEPEEADIESEYQDRFTAAELQAVSLDDRAAAFQILGSNKIEYADGITRFVIRLKQGATPLTVFEEKIEGDAQVMLREKGGREWLLSRLRSYERVSGEMLLPANDAEVTNGDLREAYSHFGMSYLVGRTRKSERGENFVDPGRAQIQKMMRNAQRSGLAVAGEGYTEFFREVMKRAAKLNKLRREGKLDAELERELARSVGFGEQAEYEASVEAEAAAFRQELEDDGVFRGPLAPSTFEPTDDAPFSVISSSFDPAVDAAVKKLEADAEDSLRLRHAWLTPKGKWLNTAAHETVIPDEIRNHGNMWALGFVRVLRDGKTLFAEGAAVNSRQAKELKDTAIEQSLTPDYDIRQKFAKFADAKFGGETSYSVITNAESRIAESFNPFLRNPEQRRKIVLEAQRRGREQASKFDEIIRRVRTAGSLSREARVREGLEYDRLLRETFNAATQAEQEALPPVDRAAARSDAKKVAADWKKAQEKALGNIDRQLLIGAMRTLDAMTSALPSELRGSIGGMVALAQIKGPEALVNELEKRSKKFDEVLEDWLRKEADKQLKKLFKVALPAKDESGKLRKGKAGANVHDLFDKLRIVYSQRWTAEQAEAYAVGLESEIAKGEMSPEREAHALMEAEAVRLIGGWFDQYEDSGKKSKKGAKISVRVKGGDGLGAEARNHALDTLTEIWKSAYADYQIQKAKEKERRDGIRSELRADTGKAGKKSERALTEMAGVKLPGRARDFFLSLLNFEQLTQWAFGKESKWAQWFADEQRKAENAKLDAVQAVTEGVEDFFTELAGGNRFKGEQLQYRMMQRSLTAKATDGDIVPLSELEALSALLMWQQEDGKRHLRGKRDENGKITSDWAYDEDFIDEISGKLSPEAWRVLGYLQGEYGKEYEPLNKVYRDIYGINLPQNANYSPLTVKPQQAAAGQTADPLTGSTVSTGSFTPGSLRSRAQVSAEPDFRDAVATFIAHKKQIEHWKAHARFVLDANAVLGNREVGNSVEAAHGQEAVKIIRKWLDAIAQGGVRDASAGTAMRRFFDRITGNAASMALVGRVGTLAVQSTQLGAAAALMPTGAYAVRLGKLLTGNLGWGAALSSPYIQRRLAQQPIMVQAAMEGLKAGKPTQIKHQVRKLGSLLNGADALFTAGTYAIAYDYHLKEAVRGGMDGAGAAAYATETAERVVESVAQPTRLGTRSYLEVSSSNPFMRLAWAFASDARKNVGLMGMAYTKGDLTDKYRAALFVVLLNGLLAGVIRSAWRDLRDDDETMDEKYWSAKRLALSTSTDWFTGFPVIGEEVQRAIMNASGEYTPDGGLLSALSQAPKAAANLIEGDSTSYLRDIEKLMTAIGMFSDNTAAATSVMHLVRDIYGLGENFTGGD